jgi:hypothetical protein
MLATADPRAALAALHDIRAPIYALADVVVDSRRGASHDAMARTIIEAVQGNDRAHPDAPPALESAR